MASLPLSAEPEKSVFDDNWLAIGIGAIYEATYDGSNDYELKPLPMIAGEIGGIRISPRSSGFSVDLLEVDLSDRLELNGGPVIKFRSDRTGKVGDEVIEAAGELDKAVELGAGARLVVKEVFHAYDRISIGADVRKDVAGAHGGMVVTPGISYRTPLSRGTVASLAVRAFYGDGDFTRYYYSVNPEQSAASGLPEYEADGGWFKASAKLSFGYALNGDLERRGFILGTQVGYSRMLGDGAKTPFTDLRGSRNQFKIATGIGYVF